MSVKAILASTLSWRPDRLAAGTMRITTGMLFRSVGQAIVFLTIARILSVDTYGAFAAALAMASIFGGLAGFGARNLLLRDTARNSGGFAVAWGNTLAALLVSVPALFAIYVAVALLTLPAEIPLLAILFLGVAELALTPIALAGVSAYQGHDRLGRAARLMLTPVLFRLSGAFLLLPLTLGLPALLYLNIWSALYALAALCAAIYSFMLVRKDLGRAVWPSLAALRLRLSAGLPFAVSVVALKIYTDIDKVMIVQFATLEAAGAYSAAHRIVEMAAIPVMSLLVAATPTMFRRGHSRNVSATMEYSARIGLVPAVYAVLIGAGIYLLSTYIPVLLGQTFSETTFALQWLALLPLLSLPRLLLQSAMVGSDRQTLAVVILIAGALLNVFLNLELIPTWGWRGAVFATYAAEILMAFAMYVTSRFESTK